MYPMGKSAEIGQLRWDPLTCASDRPNGTLLRARIHDLPDAVKAGIVAMVGAAKGAGR